MWLGRKVIYHHTRVKVYTEQFKRDAVAMYEASPDASMRKVAEELGINRSSLGYWYKQFGTNVAANDAGSSPAAKLADAERIRQLEREYKRLREEREILRKAAKYFAEETTWRSASSSPVTISPTTRLSGCAKF